MTGNVFAEWDVQQLPFSYYCEYWHTPRTIDLNELYGCACMQIVIDFNELISFHSFVYTECVVSFEIKVKLVCIYIFLHFHCHFLIFLRFFLKISS